MSTSFESALPFTTPYAPPEDERCASCGEHASPCAVGGYWLYDGKRWHPQCVDWGVRPFPYAHMLDAGRRHLRWLERERTPAPDKLLRAVAYLDELARAWPPTDPAPALERGYHATMVVEHHRLAGKSLRERRAGYPLACIYPPGVDKESVKPGHYGRLRRDIFVPPGTAQAP